MLEFDPTPLTETVKIGSTTYILREADENAARIFRNAAVRGAKMHDGKVVGVDGVGDIQSLLLSLCLFETLPTKSVVGDGAHPFETKNVAVPLQVIRGWPSRIVKPLFDRCKEMSQLDEKPSTIVDIKKQIADLTTQLHEREEAEKTDGPLSNLTSGSHPSSE